MKKYIKLAGNICFISLILCCMFFAGLRLFGFTPYVVTTTSMEPEIKAYSLVYVKPIPFENIKLDDVITYVKSDSENTVTHRVKNINDESKYLITKGDANEFCDILPVFEENVIGKVYLKFSGLGKIPTFLKTIIGKVVVS